MTSKDCHVTYRLCVMGRDSVAPLPPTYCVGCERSCCGVAHTCGCDSLHQQTAADNEVQSVHKVMSHC
ncbi:hypothetical protein J6590_067359 [Homalodisca vitripennis]|nr:hypothetical protein J6590_067359 [Homalodisca vitripennis]